MFQSDVDAASLHSSRNSSVYYSPCATLKVPDKDSSKNGYRECYVDSDEDQEEKKKNKSVLDV